MAHTLFVIWISGAFIVALLVLDVEPRSWGELIGGIGIVVGWPLFVLWVAFGKWA